MPKKSQVHTPATLKKLQPPERGIRRVAVGGVAGLELQISGTDARSWILRGTFLGKRINRGIGSVDDFSLAEAREEARKHRQAWREGRDLTTERRQIAVDNIRALKQRVAFKDFYADAITDLTSKLTNAKAAAQWTATVETYGLPVLADIPVADITTADIVAVLRPIWTTKGETARKTRGRIKNILDRAIALGVRKDANPAAPGVVAAVLGKQARGATHQPSVAWTDAPAFWTDLNAKTATSHAALRFLALTATRAGEVTGATWSEIDTDARVWTIPATRTKTRRIYRVPLTAAAMAQLPDRGAPADIVFSNGGQEMSNNTLLKAMKAITAGTYLDPDTQKAAVPHGLRASFRTWSQEQHIDREVAEACLAHIVGDGAEQAYKRSDMIETRRVVLTQWAAYLEGTS